MGTVVRADCLVHAPPARVWQVLSDLDHYGDWHPAVESLDGRAATGASIALRPRALSSDKQPTVIKGRVLVCKPEDELRIRLDMGWSWLMTMEYRVRQRPVATGDTQVEIGLLIGGLGGTLLSGLLGAKMRRLPEATGACLAAVAEGRPLPPPESLFPTATPA